MNAIAYIRKSKINPNGHGVSWEVQEAQIRELAARNGDTDLELVSDWGISGAAAVGAFGGTGRGGKRRAYRELRDRIASGGVSVIYAYSLSRLARSTRELLDLAEACAESGTVVRLAKEGTLDFTSAHGRLYLTVLAGVATFEAEVSAEKARDHVALRRSRGDHIGQAPYGSKVVDGHLETDPSQPIKPVLEAYRIAGSYHGAAKLLNLQGEVPRSAARWSDMTVRRIVARAEGAEHRPVKRGRPLRITAPLAGLLRCHCGTILTASRQTVMLHREPGTTATYTHYICWRARHDPNHSKPIKVSEGVLLPWVKAEAARLVVPMRALETDASDTRRGELQARRQRVIENFEDGMIGRDERTDKVAAIDAEIDRLEAVSVAVSTVPAMVDWSWEPETLNKVLRAMWSHIQLDTQLRPVAAEWVIPGSRQDDLTAIAMAS